MWGFYNSPPDDPVSVSQTQVCISIRYFRFLQASRFGIQISFVEIAR